MFTATLDMFQELTRVERMPGCALVASRLPEAKNE